VAISSGSDISDNIKDLLDIG